MTKVNELK